MATFNASLYTAQQAGFGVEGLISQGELHVARSTYTHTGADGQHSINLLTLPPGKVGIFSDLSRVVTSAYQTNADLHIGYRAHTTNLGAAVAESTNAFLDNADVGGGALDTAWVLPANGYTELDSRDGITLFALVDTANIEANDTLEVTVVFSKM